MASVEILPSLDRCIESTARDEFRKAVEGYMAAGCRNKDLEERISILKAFLEQSDFAELRTRSEKHLVEGKRVKFMICGRGGSVDCQMMVLGKAQL